MDRDDDDDLSCSGSVEDEPPFAFVDAPASTMRALLKLVSPIDHTLMNDKQHSFKSPSQSQETAKTAMGSSILYSPISRSQSQTNTGFGDQQRDEQMSDCRSSDHLPEEFIDNDIEFDAAASLLADSPMLGRSSHFLERSDPHVSPHDSMGFSELMQEADDQHMHHTYKSPAMPTLLEDTEMDMRTDAGASSVLTPRLSNHSMLGIVMNRDVSRKPRSPNLFNKRGIETKRLDQDTFEVSMSIYSDCSMQDVMDIVGNPDLLRLWCEPVRTLVVTRSSEGARSAANRTDSGRGDREYDGEWIEATTSTLATPSRHTSTMYQMSQFIWSHLGFPSYGRITMFVERRRGRVGLTMGPFGGDLTAFHTITAELGDGFVQVTDRVRIVKENGEDHSSIICCCGLCEVMQRCFLPPKLDGHIDQSVASMTRLRVMIENGENALMADDVPALIVDGEDETVSRQPLLS